MDPQHQESVTLSMEAQIRTVVGYLLLAAVPVVMLLLVLATKPQGPKDFAAMDHAQLAKHIAAGEGFITTLIRPLSLGVKPQVAAHPDLYNAPLHPLVLSAFFRAGKPTDRMAAVAGMVMWTLSVWLTFAVARFWVNARVAALAAVFYGCNVGAIVAATGGYPHGLLAIWVLLALWLAVPSKPDIATVVTDVAPTKPVAAPRAPDLPWWRFALAGVAVGLAVLTNYLMVILLVLLAVYVLYTSPKPGRCVGALAGGCLLTLAPWLVRNWQVVGSPLFSLYWYEAMSHTNRYPGETLWRTVNLPVGLVSFMASHPLEMYRKLTAGIAQFRTGVVNTLDPVVTLLAVTGLLCGAAARRWRGLWAVVIFGMVLSVAAACLMLPEPGVVLAWLPVLAIVAAENLYSWVQQHVGPVRINLLPDALVHNLAGAPPNNTRRKRMLGAVWTRLAAYVGVIAIVAFPLAMYLTAKNKTPVDPTIAKRMEGFAKMLPKNSLVMTDQPAWISWNLPYRAVWLLQKEEDWETVKRASGIVEMMYITPYASELSDQERGVWWSWVTSMRGVYRDLLPMASSNRRAIVRLRATAKVPVPTSTELETWRTEAQRDTKSADVHVRLAKEYFDRERMREAYEEYRTAVLMDAHNTEALLGLQQVGVVLEDPSNSLVKIQSMLQLSAENPGTLLAIEQAAQMFERALSMRPTNAWLLLNAALFQAKLKHWPQTEELYRRLSKTAPRAFPVRLLMGDLYLQQGLIDEAATEFTRMIEEQRNNPLAHEALSRAHWSQGKLREAVADLLEAARLRPDWAVPHQQAGFICLEMKNYPEAVVQFRKALILQPSMMPSVHGLARAMTEQGEWREAIVTYEKALKENPNSPAVLNNLADLRLKIGNLDVALVLAKKSVSIDPTNGASRDTLGWIHHLLQHPEEALTNLEAAARLAPNNSLIHFHLGKILQAAGRNPEAAREFKAALEYGITGDDKIATELALAIVSRPAK